MKLIERIEMVEWFDDRIYKLFPLGEQRAIRAASVTTVLGAIPAPYRATWRGEVGNVAADRKMREAAERGSRIHHAVYVWLTGGVVLFQRAAVEGYGRPDAWQSNLAEQNKRVIGQCKAMDIPYFVLDDQWEFVQFLNVTAFVEGIEAEVVAAEFVVYDVEREGMELAGTSDMLLRIPKGAKVNTTTGVKLTYEEGGLYLYDLKTGMEDETSHPLQTGQYARMWELLQPGEKIVGTGNIYSNAGKRTPPQMKVTLQGREEIERGWGLFDAIHKVFRATTFIPTDEEMKFPTVKWRGATALDVPRGFLTGDARKAEERVTLANLVQETVQQQEEKPEEREAAAFLKEMGEAFVPLPEETVRSLLERAYGKGVDALAKVMAMPAADILKGKERITLDVREVYRKMAEQQRGTNRKGTPR